MILVVLIEQNLIELPASIKVQIHEELNVPDKENQIFQTRKLIKNDSL